MVVHKFIFKENWIGNKVFGGMKTIFLAIFDSNLDPHSDPTRPK